MEKLTEFLKNIDYDHSLSNVTYVPLTAWIGHAPFLVYLLKVQRPTKFVELGTHFGYSYFAACETIQKFGLDTQAFAVDTWAGDSHAGYYDEGVFSKVSALNSSYSKFSTLIRDDFNNAVNNFEDASIDLLHIDGEHTYDAVKRDFETWLPKISANGIVIFHDIFVRVGNFGVHQFWEEIKKDYETFEFTHSYGLGVLFLNSDLQPPELLRFVESTKADNLRIQGAFAVHSSNIISKQISLRIGIEGQDPVAAADVCLQQVFNSTSWKVTKPLRILGKFLRKIY